MRSLAPVNQTQIDLEIRLFGPIDVRVCGQPLRLRSRKGLWLLALLALRTAARWECATGRAAPCGRTDASVSGAQQPAAEFLHATAARDGTRGGECGSIRRRATPSRSTLRTRMWMSWNSMPP